MEEILINDNECPITGFNLDDRVTARYRKEPPGYYAGHWEVRDKPVKEKQVREKRIISEEERRRINTERNRSNYNKDKKHHYYLTRKALKAQQSSL
jgi:hypothetical protein